jgi:hypothetical protein
MHLSFHSQPAARRIYARIIAHVALMLLCGISCGCWWKKKEPALPDNPFPLARLGSDTVVLELGVLRVTEGDREQLDTAWRHLDSQHIPFHVRKLLDENGFRTGLSGSQLPNGFLELMEPDPIRVAELNEYQLQLYENGYLKPEKKQEIHQRIQNRAGQSYSVPISKVEQQISWVVKTEKGQTPGQVDQAMPFFAITTYPNGNGTVSVVITPEIQYGQMKNRISSHQNQAIYREAKQSLTFDDLAINATLRPGETIMITSNSNASALGRAMFQSLDAASGEQRILMIRLAHSQHDDLFSRRPHESTLSTVD